MHLFFVVFDAGGHPSGFFTGNDFWTGSKMLCYSLVYDNSSKSIDRDSPPFQVDFFVTRVELDLLKESTIPQVRSKFTSFGEIIQLAKLY